MTQEGWAVWEGAARRQYDWVGGQGLSPILGPWGTDPTGDQTRRRASELSIIAAQSAADQVPPWGALHTGPPAPRHAGAHGRRRPLRTHGKHPTRSLCNLLLARRLTESGTSCPGVWCWVLRTRYPCSL